MKRELKFRAWTKEHWINQGMLYEYQNSIFLESNGWDEFPIMQFTGLKDKKGVDVYEGDILTTKYQDKAKMIWYKRFACFCYKTIGVKGEYQFSFKNIDIEIIGNIYENPELL